jgi:hypothetical protein
MPEKSVGVEKRKLKGVEGVSKQSLHTEFFLGNKVEISIKAMTITLNLPYLSLSQKRFNTYL